LMLEWRMRQCFKCVQWKPESEFYGHQQMTAKILGKCKECTKADVRANRLERLEYYRAYDRQRAKLPHRVSKNTSVTRNWRAKHPGRSNAQYKAGRHHRKAPDACQMCGLKKRLERHHPDYALPLLIVWLCKPCHVIADRVRREREAQ
jgi:hypothetical protein